MKTTLSILLKIILVLPCFAFANLDKAPKNIKLDDGSAVFVDILNSKHNLTYDFNSKKLDVESLITFKTNSPGFPIFDILPSDEFQDVIIIDKDKNESIVQIVDLIIPDEKFETINLKRLSKSYESGEYHISLKYSLNKVEQNHYISHGLIFSTKEKTIDDFLFISDGDTRNLLEKRLLANLEYDQFPMELNIELIGTNIAHKVKANGIVTTFEDAPHIIKVNYPAFYNSASFFYHLFPEKNYSYKDFDFISSTTGKITPVTIYGKSSEDLDLETIAQKTNSYMMTFDTKLGVWPHDSLVVYLREDDTRSMEYAGATVLGAGHLYLAYDEALRHELLHSYFARSVMPDSKSSWFDEAMVTLLDEWWHYDESNFYRYLFNVYYCQDLSVFVNCETNEPATYKTARFFYEDIHGKLERNPYQRRTNQDSYSYGGVVIGRIMYLMNGSKDEGFIELYEDFLKYFHAKHMHEVISSSQIEEAFLEFARTQVKMEEGVYTQFKDDLNRIFKNHVYYVEN